MYSWTVFIGFLFLGWLALLPLSECRTMSFGEAILSRGQGTGRPSCCITRVPAVWTLGRSQAITRCRLSHLLIEEGEAVASLEFDSVWLGDNFLRQDAQYHSDRIPETFELHSLNSMTHPVYTCTCVGTLISIASFCFKVRFSRPFYHVGLRVSLFFQLLWFSLFVVVTLIVWNCCTRCSSCSCSEIGRKKV